jgi:D-glycero-D-manno-heptose 1,7-bisphosphate phosphatase
VGVSALKAVFLDRDVVLNRAIVCAGKPYPPAGVHELEILPDVPEALALLKSAGFLLLVVTNQPDVARGRQQRAAVENIHATLRKVLPVDDFFVCYHDDTDACDCRKPQPGLLLRAAAKYGLQLSASYLIGDRWRDIEAGRAAGCRTVWIRYAYTEKPPSKPDATFRSCLEAARWILSQPADL